MDVVDANYTYLLVDVGVNCRASNAGVYASSTNTLNISPAQSEAGRQKVYVVVEMKLLAWKRTFMNGFGVLGRTMYLNPERDTPETKSSVTLHNFL